MNNHLANAAPTITLRVGDTPTLLPWYSSKRPDKFLHNTASKITTPASLISRSLYTLCHHSSGSDTGSDSGRLCKPVTSGIALHRRYRVRFLMLSTLRGLFGRLSC